MEGWAEEEEQGDGWESLEEEKHGEGGLQGASSYRKYIKGHGS